MGFAQVNIGRIAAKCLIPVLLIIGGLPAPTWSLSLAAEPVSAEEENSIAEQHICHRKTIGELVSQNGRHVRSATQNSFHHAYQANHHQTTPRAAEHDLRNGLGAPLLT